MQKIILKDSNLKFIRHTAINTSKIGLNTKIKVEEYTNVECVEEMKREM